MEYRGWNEKKGQVKYANSVLGESPLKGDFSEIHKIRIRRGVKNSFFRAYIITPPSFSHFN